MRYLVQNIILTDSSLVLSKLLRSFILAFGLGLAQPMFAEEALSEEEENNYVDWNLYQTFDAFGLATINAEIPGSLLLESRDDFQSFSISGGSLLSINNTYYGQKNTNTTSNTGPGSPADTNIPFDIPINDAFSLWLLSSLGCVLFIRRVQMIKEVKGCSC